MALGVVGMLVESCRDATVAGRGDVCHNQFVITILINIETRSRWQQARSGGHALRGRGKAFRMVRISSPENVCTKKCVF